jgi:hypothetical protein
MKKLNKLQINPDKLINNKELMTLKGGYSNCCRCVDMWGLTVGFVQEATIESCDFDCVRTYPGGPDGWWEC